MKTRTQVFLRLQEAQSQRVDDERSRDYYEGYIECLEWTLGLKKSGTPPLKRVVTKFSQMGLNCTPI